MKNKNIITMAIIVTLVSICPALIPDIGQLGKVLQSQESNVSIPDANESTKAPDVIAHFHLCGTLTEKPMEDTFGFTAGQMTSLRELLRRLEQARNDKSVKAVVLTFDRMTLGFGQIEEIRSELKRLKQANKRLYVHAEGMCTGVYTLLCAASDFSVAPQSNLWLIGLYGESPYVKGLLDKIGVEADFVQIGDYKSAAEMLTRSGPSEPANENINWLLDGLYGSLVDMIAESRGITPRRIRKLIDDGPYTAKRAMALGLLDSVKYRDAFLAEIKGEFGQDVKFNNRYAVRRDTQIDFSSPFAFFSIFSSLARRYQKTDKDIVALIYVDGMILPGYGQPSLFGGSNAAYSGDIRKAMERAAKNKLVKAVVMRVNSPGGSAEASEVIWNAAKQVKMKKPLIVSMGNIAGSGGYYVSCGADTIFADETTITASVGVVGGKFVTAGMWDKLGVSWVGYKRGANADFFNSARPFDEPQRAKLTQYMEQVYTVFKQHVSEARADKLARPIEKLAGGRIYTGKQAVELGMVDRIGGLSEAIEYAAAQASISDYEVRVIPRPKDFFTVIMETMSGKGENPTDISVSGSAKLIDSISPSLQSVFTILGRIDPLRARAFRRVVERIELINREGVALLMPQEFIIY